jgi:hypothetical protein
MGPGTDKLRRFRLARAGGKLRAAVEKVNGTANERRLNADEAEKMPQKAQRKAQENQAPLA